MKLAIKPRLVVKVLITILMVLIVAHVIASLSYIRVGEYDEAGMMRLFHFGFEANVPAYYSAILLFFCSLLLYVIYLSVAKSHGRYRKYWLALSIAFAYMSIDEATQIHETWHLLIPVLRDYATQNQTVSGILRFPWVSVGGVIVVVFSLVFLPFLLALERKWRMLFLLAGVTYVGGALGFEIFGGIVKGFGFIHYEVVSAIEEVLEITGVSIFLCTLLAYIKNECKKIELTFDSKYTETPITK